MGNTDFRSDDARAEAERAAQTDEQIQGRDPGKIDEEAMRKAEGLTVKDDVRENYQEATERGAAAKGEGRVP